MAILLHEGVKLDIFISAVWLGYFQGCLEYEVSTHWTLFSLCLDLHLTINIINELRDFPYEKLKVIKKGCIIDLKDKTRSFDPSMQ